MTPAQLSLLAQAHNRYHDPEAGKEQTGGLAAFAEMAKG